VDLTDGLDGCGKSGPHQDSIPGPSSPNNNWNSSQFTPHLLHNSHSFAKTENNA